MLHQARQNLENMIFISCFTHQSLQNRTTHWKLSIDDVCMLPFKTITRLSLSTFALSSFLALCRANLAKGNTSHKLRSLRLQTQKPKQVELDFEPQRAENYILNCLWVKNTGYLRNPTGKRKNRPDRRPWSPVGLGFSPFDPFRQWFLNLFKVVLGHILPCSTGDVDVDEVFLVWKAGNKEKAWGAQSNKTDSCHWRRKKFEDHGSCQI